MLTTLKNGLRTCLLTVGLDIRIASKIRCVDPLEDIKKLHGKGDFKTVIDIGANVGQSALRFHKAFPQASIHSFEPVPASFEAGRNNTAKYGRIMWHHLAVGNTNKHIIFHSSGTSQSNSITNADVNPTAYASERNEVEMVRFDDFLSTNQLPHIDLLKTDTEGLDLAVLQGAEAALATGRISYILCEAGFSREDRKHSFFPPIADYLEKFGYRLVCFYGIAPLDYFRHWGVAFGDALFAIPKTTRCVSIKNLTDQPITFQVAINGATAEPLTLASQRGVFFFEPLPERIPYASLPRTHISISGPDGSRMASDVIVGELAAILTPAGRVTTSGFAGADSDFGVPDKEWLSENHLEARPIQNLRSVEASIPPAIQ